MLIWVLRYPVRRVSLVQRTGRRKRGKERTRMAETGCGFAVELAAAGAVFDGNQPKEIPTLEATITVDRSPPNVIVDESSLGEHRDKNAENLKLRLGMRRDIGTLVDQGIMPPMHTPQAFFEQRQRFERAKISDKLKAKIQQRPGREVLIQQHILEETGNNVDPSLVEKHKQLKRARIADQLNKSISDRPGPLEVIKAGILHVDDNLENDVRDGKIQFKKTSEGAVPKRPQRPFALVEEEGACPPPNAIAVGVDQVAPVQPTASPLPVYKSESVLAELSPPSVSNETSVQSPPVVALPVSRCSSMPVFTSKETSSLPTNPTFVPGTVRTVGKMMHRAAGGGKARSLKSNKSSSCQTPKQKIYTFHMYHGPSSAKKELQGKAETKYEILVQQQQTILQYELESQQKRILPSSQKPPNSGESSTASGRRNSRSASDSNGPKSLSKMEDMKVRDLKIEAQIRGLPVSGSKAQLIERLQPYADVITSAAHGSLPTNSTPSPTPVVASQSPLSCFSPTVIPVLTAAEPLMFSATSPSAVIVKAAEPHEAVDGHGSFPTQIDKEMQAPLPMDIDDSLPLTAVPLASVFGAPTGMPVILNVNSDPSQEFVHRPPPPPPPLPTTLARGLPIFVPVVNVPIVQNAVKPALPIAQQPIVAIAGGGQPPPPYQISSAQGSEGMILQIMNQFKELKEQLDSSGEKKTPEESKFKFQWPSGSKTQVDEDSQTGLKLSWKFGGDQEMTLPVTSSSVLTAPASTLSFAKPVVERQTWPPLPTNLLPPGGSWTFTVAAPKETDENPSVTEIQPSFDFTGNAVKSQVVDDILDIVIKNGDLPPRAANDILTPTPEPERMESGPSFPVPNDSNNNSDNLSPMNDENSNHEDKPHPPPTPPPLPPQRLGVCPTKTYPKDNVLMETSASDSCDFNDFLNMIGNTGQSSTACDLFSDMDLSLLDNCGNVNSVNAASANQPKKYPEAKSNGFVLPNASSANVDVSTLLDCWATAATSLPSDPSLPYFDAQSFLDI